MDTQNSFFYEVNQMVQLQSTVLYCIWLSAITKLRATCPFNWHHVSLESLQQSSQANVGGVQYTVPKQTQSSLVLT